MKYQLKHHIDKIIDMHNQGKLPTEIAEVFSVSDVAIRKQLRKHGIEPNKAIPDFTEEQINKIKELYKQRKDCVYIANELGTTQARILKMFERLGFDSTSYFFRKEEEADLRRLYEQEFKTIEEIADIYGCYRQAVDVAFKRFGIKGRNHAERKQIHNYVNRKAFTDWKDEETCFYYGLLLSDGCISDRGKVVIALQVSDKHILESFANYMESSNSVHKCKTDGSSYSFGFLDSVVAGNLTKAGMAPRKSTEETYPECIDRNDLESCKHFWRGYICGDGHIRAYDGVPKIHICGSREICQEFKDFSERVLGRKLKPIVREYKDKRRKKTLYYFTFGGRAARDVGLFMFENCKVTIDRKYKATMEFKNWNPAPKNKVYGIYKKSNKFEVSFYAMTKSTAPIAVFDSEEEAIKYRLELELQHYGYHKSLA